MNVAVALVEDLMFLSRIREAARPQGVDVRVVRRAEDLVGACRTAAPALVVVDLDAARLRPTEAVAALRSVPDLAGLPVVGFLSHVHADRAADARTAGCTRVLARSAFVQELPSLFGAAGSDARS